MDSKSKEIVYFRQVFQRLVGSIYIDSKQYYLKDSGQVYSELISSFTRICSLLYSNPMTPKFLEGFITIYQHYNWILKKINPDSDLLSIPNVFRLGQVLKELLVFIKKFIPLFHSVKYPTHDHYLVNRVQKIIDTFKLY